MKIWIKSVNRFRWIFVKSSAVILYSSYHHKSKENLFMIYRFMLCYVVDKHIWGFWWFTVLFIKESRCSDWGVGGWSFSEGIVSRTRSPQLDVPSQLTFPNKDGDPSNLFHRRRPGYSNESFRETSWPSTWH